MVCSADAVLASLDRAQLYAGLRSVSARLGPENFPLVPLAYFANTKLGMPPPNELFASSSSASASVSISAGAAAAAPSTSRIVVKVGSCNAGFGKFMATDARQREDLWSVLATQKEYVTEEAFVEHAFEYRLQVIGAHLRCFKRNSTSSWKNNSGNLTFEAMPVEPKHAEWAAALRALYGGGNDVFGLDVLRRADGTDVVLEINPSANGLMYEFEAEDCARIRDLVLQRIGIETVEEEAAAPKVAAGTP